MTLLLSAPIAANATITLAPNSGGSQNGSPFYYFVQFPGYTPLTAPAFLANGISPLDITQSAYSGAEPSTGYPNRFEINFYSDIAPPTLTGTQTVVVTFQSYPIVTSPIHPAPIATINGVACNSNICQGLNAIGSSNHYYAALYTPQTTMRIGFYPQDICADYAVSGGAATGCANGVVTPPTSAVATAMQLQFTVTVAADTVSYPPAVPTAGVTGGGATVGAVLDQTPNPVGFTFENVQPILTCPSQAALNAAVIPGDGQIFINTTIFGIGNSNLAGGAPAASLIVVGQDSALTAAAPDVSSAFAANNTINAQLGLSNSLTPMTGFTNSTSTTPHAYTLSFLGLDRAGVYVGASPVSDCSISPVESATIQGFLAKSNCFIATAAFRSIDAAPVRLLREFRDSILLPTSWGRNFVQWYYGWSPPAAEWLMLHPEFRVPVLLFLTPLEMIAWLCLHPVLIYALFGAVILLLASIGRHSLMRKEKGLR